MRIWIDNREDNRFIRIGKEHYPNAMIAQLPKGDIVVENKGKWMCIEHKGIEDFRASTIDKRLSSQPIKMTESFDYNFVFVVGSYEDMDIAFGGEGFTEKHYNGKIASLALKYVVPPITVVNDAHCWRMIDSFIERLKEAGKPLVKPIIMENVDDNVYVRMLSQIENLGPTRARLILDEIPFWELPFTTKEELMEIKGIGEKFAETIVKVSRSRENTTHL